MEKLIELLNEYEEKRIKRINAEWKLFVKLSFRPYTEESLTNKAYRSCWLEICSKYYGFIKWLVENNKIDFDNRDLKDRFMNEFERYPRFQNNTINREFNINGLIMLLSIQDNPIEFLISVLK